MVPICSPQAAPYVPFNKPPPTIFDVQCHPQADAVCAELDGFFVKNWPFKSQKERNKFLASQVPRWSCLAFPMADKDRLSDTAKVNTILFLLDGKFTHAVEDMSLEEGKQFLKRLTPIAKGETLPDRSNPYEWIVYDVWNNMRACDKELADQVLRGALICISAQVDSERLACQDMGSLLRHKVKESGVAFVGACVRYSARLHICDETLKSLEGVEASCGKLGAIVNDIYSFDKELYSWNQEQKEGAKLVNVVDHMAFEAGVSYSTAKRILWVLCRELEVDHQALGAKAVAGEGGADPAVKTYLKGLEYAMGGNECWSATTERYHRRD